MNNFYIYIVASNSRKIYTGMTNNLERRIFEHKNKTIKGFTARYIYYEVFSTAQQAIDRETQLKG
jgi:putative endonuclease